jgi:predicted sugar kinase
MREMDNAVSCARSKVSNTGCIRVSQGRQVVIGGWVVKCDESEMYSVVPASTEPCVVLALTIPSTRTWASQLRSGV